MHERQRRDAGSITVGGCGCLMSVSFSTGVKSSSVIKANLCLVPSGEGKAGRVRRQQELKKKWEIKARDGCSG